MTDERSDLDYAIEHGRYLANAAEQFLLEQNRAAQAGSLPGSEYWSSLETAIYEFRKRADRADRTTRLVRRLAVIQRSRENLAAASGSPSMDTTQQRESR